MTEHRLNIVKEKYRIADLNIVMTTYHKETMERAKPYRSEIDFSEEKADGIIDLGQDFYEKVYQQTMPYSNYTTIEYMHTGSKFNRLLLEHNGCMLHSSAVVIDGYAYLFSADSGIGKSTHTELWLKHFGERAYIINDDKPAIRFVENTLYVYGTPWSGKHNINKNIRVRLGGIVFLERSEYNWIVTPDVKEAIQLFFKQTIRKLETKEKMECALEIMEKILTLCPIYKMGCNISDEAVTTAYEKIRRV